MPPQVVFKCVDSVSRPALRDNGLLQAPAKVQTQARKVQKAAPKVARAAPKVARAAPKVARKAAGGGRATKGWLGGAGGAQDLDKWYGELS